MIAVVGARRETCCTRRIGLPVAPGIGDLLQTLHISLLCVQTPSHDFRTANGYSKRLPKVVTRDGGALGADGCLGPVASLASLPLGQHPPFAATGARLISRYLC